MYFFYIWIAADKLPKVPTSDLDYRRARQQFRELSTFEARPDWLRIVCLQSYSIDLYEKWSNKSEKYREFEYFRQKFYR